MEFREQVRMREYLRRSLTLLSIVAPVRPLTGPYSVSMEVATRCNYSCLICPYHSPLAKRIVQSQTDFIGMDVASRVLAGAAKLGVKVVHFGGRGEPLMHPEFAGIVSLATRQGMQTRVLTNGSLLTPQRMQELIDAGLARLTVSLIGATPESYVRMVQGASTEAFHSILDSLAAFQQLKRETGSATPKIELRFIVLKGIHLEVDEMVNLGIRLGAANIQLAPLMYRSDFDADAFALSREEERQAVDRLREMAPVAAEAGLKTNLPEFAAYHHHGPASPYHPCYASWIEMNVINDGTVRFCARSDGEVGNVNERSLEEIWQDARWQKLRRLAKNSSDRSSIGRCDCNRCCLFYSNWVINRRLQTFGLAPEIECRDSDHSVPALDGELISAPAKSQRR